MLITFPGFVPIVNMIKPFGSFVRNLNDIELCLPVSHGGSICKFDENEKSVCIEEKRWVFWGKGWEANACVCCQRTPSHTHCNTYQMRVSCCERDRILWITSRTLVCHTTSYLNEFRTSPCQIDQIQAKCVGRKFNLFNIRKTKKRE